VRVALVVLLCACSGSQQLAVDHVERCGPPQGPASLPALMPDARTSAFFASHPLPQLQNGGGPVLASPRITAVFASDDPLREPTEALLQSYGCTSYWREAVAEYGVGDIALDQSLVADDMPALVDQATIESWLRSNANRLGTWNDNSLVFLFASAAHAMAPDDCSTSVGFHGFVTSGSQSTAYAIVKNCPMVPLWATPLDERAHATTHELIEAATDPRPGVFDGWRGLDQPGPISIAGEDEAADLCDDRLTDYVDYPFEVAAGWSNRRAKAGLDPCSSSPAPLAILAPRVTSIDLPVTGEASFDADFFAAERSTPFNFYYEVDVTTPRCLAVSTDVSLDTPIMSGATVHFTVQEMTGTCSVTSTQDGLRLKAYGDPTQTLSYELNSFVAITGY
jgi:hypothetical protein